MPKIAVTTPTGNVGHEVAERLLSQGVEVTLLARRPEKVADLAGRGARVVRGDQSGVNSILSVLEGADALFWVTPPDIAAPSIRAHYRRLAEVGAQAVRRHPAVRVVNLSSVGADLPEGMGPIKGLYDGERLFNDATENVTHLRANYFMENVLAFLSTVAGQGAIYSTIPGEVTLPQVATRDIAAAAVKILLNGDPGRHVLDVFGPEEVSFARVAQVLSEVLGRPVAHVVVAREPLRSGLLGAGLSADMADQLLEMYDAIAHGRLKGVAEAGWKGATSFDEFARQVVVRAYRRQTEMAKAG